MSDSIRFADPTIAARREDQLQAIAVEQIYALVAEHLRKIDHDADIHVVGAEAIVERIGMGLIRHAPRIASRVRLAHARRWSAEGAA